MIRKCQNTESHIVSTTLGNPYLRQRYKITENELLALEVYQLLHTKYVW